MNDMPHEVVLPQNMFEKPIKHYKQIIPVTIHHFYITGEIDDEVDRYVDMINDIKTAEQHDQIYIYLNTPGGSLTTTIQIISAIKQSQAQVITSVEGEVCSAGTFIFLSGDDFIVNDNCSFMIHNYRHGPMGKGNEVAQRVRFTEEYFSELAQNIYMDFLSPTEIDEVLMGKDLWMTSKEIRERLQSRITELEVPPQPAEEVTAEPPPKRKRKSSKDTSKPE